MNWLTLHTAVLVFALVASGALGQTTLPVVRIPLDVEAGHRELAEMSVLDGSRLMRVMINTRAEYGADSTYNTTLYDLNSGDRVSLPTGFKDHIALQVSPNRRFAVCTRGTADDRSQHVLDLHDGKVLYSIQDSGSQPYAFSGDSSLFMHLGYAPNDQMRWKIIRLPGCETVREIPIDRTSWEDPSFTADNKRVFARSNAGLSLWELSTGKLLWRHSFERGEGVYSIAFTEPEHVVNAMLVSGQILTLDADTGLEVRRASTPFMYYRLEAGMMSLTEDGHYAIRTGPHGLIYFDVATGKPIGIFSSSIAPSPLPTLVGPLVPTLNAARNEIVILRMKNPTALDPLPPGVITPIPTSRRN
jgi:hypothetical protein